MSTSSKLGVLAVNGSTSAFLTLSVAFALASPVGGRGPALPIFRAVDRDSDAEVLLRTGNPVPLMANPGAGRKRDWIQFRTDACGTLLTIDHGRSILRRSSLDDGDVDEMNDQGMSDDLDDLDDMDDQDPADLGKALIGRWLSAHPEIAVIGDGIDRSCDDGPYFDEDLPSDIEALSPGRPTRSWDRLKQTS